MFAAVVMADAHVVVTPTVGHHQCGKYRSRELNIGVAPEVIAAEVRSSLDSIRYRWEHTQDWTPRERRSCGSGADALSSAPAACSARRERSSKLAVPFSDAVHASLSGARTRRAWSSMAARYGSNPCHAIIKCPLGGNCGYATSVAIMILLR